MRAFLFVPICLVLIALAAALWTLPGYAAEKSFELCLQQLQSDALASKVPKSVVSDVLDNIQPIERVLASDRSQPEFVKTFPEYFSVRVNQQRISQGRALLAEHNDWLKALERKSGVPAHYLLALWGLETNFGGYFGKLSIPAALATLACDSRRADFFKGELLAVLQIIAAGDMTKEQLIGSWAGAIGHMQFMPTTFLAAAIDGDADGKRDLMNRSDALASGANYLQELGWQTGYRWGREVRLPEDFDYSTSGSDQWQSLDRWRELGVTTAFGGPLPQATLTAALLLPAGHTGPAFLVYPNYKIILNWNRSHFYALSVGRLADRIAGAAPLQQSMPAPESIALSSKRVKALQTRLNALGFPAGEPDGVFGSGTSAAVRKAQAKYGFLADGYPTEALFTRLLQNTN